MRPVRTHEGACPCFSSLQYVPYCVPTLDHTLDPQAMPFHVRHTPLLSEFLLSNFPRDGSKNNNNSFGTDINFLGTYTVTVLSHVPFTDDMKSLRLRRRRYLAQRRSRRRLEKPTTKLLFFAHFVLKYRYVSSRSRELHKTDRECILENENAEGSAPTVACVKGG